MKLRYEPFPKVGEIYVIGSTTIAKVIDTDNGMMRWVQCIDGRKMWINKIRGFKVATVEVLDRYVEYHNRWRKAWNDTLLLAWRQEIDQKKSNLNDSGD